MGAEGVVLDVFLAYFSSSVNHQEYQVVGVGALGSLTLLHCFRKCEIKNIGLIQ